VHGFIFMVHAKISRAKPKSRRDPNNFSAVSGVLHLRGAHICLASDYTML
jgi:hypothetical protein